MGKNDSKTSYLGCGFLTVILVTGSVILSINGDDNVGWWIALASFSLFCFIVLIANSIMDKKASKRLIEKATLKNAPKAAKTPTKTIIGTQKATDSSQTTRSITKDVIRDILDTPRSTTFTTQRTVPQLGMYERAKNVVIEEQQASMALLIAFWFLAASFTFSDAPYLVMRKVRSANCGSRILCSICLYVVSHTEAIMVRGKSMAIRIDCSLFMTRFVLICFVILLQRYDYSYNNGCVKC